MQIKFKCPSCNKLNEVELPNDAIQIEFMKSEILGKRKTYKIACRFCGKMVFYEES